MDSKTNDVKEFFDEAVKIKEQRGKNYDNGGKSAFERSMDMFDEKKCSSSINLACYSKSIKISFFGKRSSRDSKW